MRNVCEKISTSILITDDKDMIVSYHDPSLLFYSTDIINRRIHRVVESLAFEVCIHKLQISHLNIKDYNTLYFIFATKTLNPKNIHDLNCFTLKKILDYCHDEVYVANGEGICIYANKAAEKNYGVKVEDLLGKSGWQLERENVCTPPITPIAMNEKKTVTIEQTTKIGKKLVLTATPLLDKKGNIDIIVENSRDITELEKIKQDLETTRRQLNYYEREVEEFRRHELLSSESIASKSKKMSYLLDTLQRVATTDTTILFLGESGTGKSLLAKSTHKLSNRSDGPFITINCATIPEQLLESELFGYAPGAFSGASKEGKIGLFELANNGTLFLDEIAEIPLHLQAKILEAIQERVFTPVGSVKKKNIDVRIIAATNKNLKKLVKENSFREDLYYRLSIIELEIPPLREREEDIISLIYFFLQKFDKKYGFSHQLADSTLDILSRYAWPGNIRELEHTLERLVVTSRSTEITPEALPSHFFEQSEIIYELNFPGLIPFDNAVEELERQLIRRAYDKYKNTYRVADALKISQSKAYRLINKYIPDRDQINYS